ncbi:MAG: hypothetical protein UV40_C0021G0021 [Parcubacteria group bacterium GW2011_GWA1_42_7]|nr:MAG: hypothetical protein UV40_C0021G0021 [Parcubacteria group bacterium GW2011_GWA1_42_7]KKS91445.1 MAG: hypothetical protein UV67_C0027G0006 [Parcubacteria group bacterium GW2011_GWC1_43_12]
MRFIIRILGNVLAIYIAANFIDNFTAPKDWKPLLLAGLILALFNAVLKPFLKLISAPIIVITFGLFTFLINIFLLWLLTLIITELKISGVWTYLIGTLIIGLTNWAVEAIMGKKKED